MSIEPIYPPGSPFFENMYTPTNAYKRKISSGLVLAILALSSFALILAIAPGVPAVQAANAKVSATASYPYATVVDTAVKRGITVTNPLGNAGITEININIPLGAAESGTTPTITTPAAGMPTSTCTVAGTGPWTAVCVSSVASGDTILPAGAAAVLQPGWVTETAESSAGTADHFTFTVTIDFSDGTSQTTTDTFYEGSLATTNAVPTAASLPSVTAGSAITYDLTLASSDSGIPLQWFSNPSVAGVAGDGFSASFGTPTFTSSSSTTYSSTFTSTEASATSCANNDNGAIDSSFPCGYFAWVDVGTPSAYDIGGLLTPQFDGTNVPVADAQIPVAMDSVAVLDAVGVLPAAPTQVSLGSCYDVAGYSISVVDSSAACALTISLADKYGNAASPAGLAATAVLTPAIGSVWCTAGTHACSAASPEGVVTAGFATPVFYAPLAPTTDYPISYGSFDVISAKLSVTAPADIVGTYAGVSKTLEIGNLYCNTAIPACATETAPIATNSIYDTPYVNAANPAGANVEAGTPVNLAATYTIPTAAANFPAYTREQGGVPINLTLTTTPASVGPYTGTFSDKLTWIIVTTTTAGVATANFTSDTFAGDAASATVVPSDPQTTTPSNTWPAIADGTYITGDATPAGLLVQADTYSGTGACPVPSVTTPSTYVAPGGYMCLDALLRDAYGNSVDWAGNFALQITLATSGGSLSGTTVYIVAPNGDTFGSGYQVEFTAPAVTGTVTITSSTTQAGIASGSDVISVVTIAPEVSLTPPAVTTFFSTGTYTVTINATSIPSPAAVPGTVIVSFAYSLNGASSVTAPLTGANSTGAGFTSFTVTLNQGSNTVKIYATDSAGNTGSATFTFTVTPVTAFFTTPGAAQETSAGFTGLEVNFTNTGGAQAVNVYFVWYNSANQIVNIGAQLNVSFTAGQTQSFFNAYTVAGTYTVQAFVRSTSNSALSTSYSATVTIS